MPKFIQNGFKIYFKKLGYDVMFSQLKNNTHLKTYIKNNKLTSEFISPAEYNMALAHFTLLNLHNPASHK